MGRILLPFLTVLSLLASIGSFVIAVLPLIQDGALIVVSKEGLKKPPKARPPEVLSERATGPRSTPSVEAFWLEWKVFGIKACLSVIIVSAIGLAIIRVIRMDQGNI